MHEAGKRQRRPDFPAPLAAGTLLARIGTLGVPATMLSFASLLAFAIVLAAIQHSAEFRSLYRFPWWPGGLLWLAALGSAALAWVIVIVASRRPGPRWPRLWALALALAATLIAVGTLVRPAWLPLAQLHALVTAALAGALALAPRLARVHPANAWLPAIAPVGFLGTLLLILPPALTGGARGPAAPPGAGWSGGTAGLAEVGQGTSGRWSGTGGTRGDVALDPAPRALMQRTLFTLGGQDYRWNQIARLWGIDLAAARRLQPGGRNDCGGSAFDQPGQEYRIDCYSDAPAAPGRRADPVAEMRIVYSAQAGPLTGRATPSELWYGFALGPGLSKPDQERRKRETMRAFYDAVKDPAANLSGGSDADLADHGFTLRQQGQAWKALPPFITRHPADREWVVIRVVPD